MLLDFCWLCFGLTPSLASCGRRKRGVRFRAGDDGTEAEDTTQRVERFKAVEGKEFKITVELHAPGRRLVAVKEEHGRRTQYHTAFLLRHFSSHTLNPGEDADRMACAKVLARLVVISQDPLPALGVRVKPAVGAFGLGDW
jgi:hypothetical protein